MNESNDRARSLGVCSQSLLDMLYELSGYTVVGRVDESLGALACPHRPDHAVASLPSAQGREETVGETRGLAHLSLAVKPIKKYKIEEVGIIVVVHGNASLRNHATLHGGNCSAAEQGVQPGG